MTPVPGILFGMVRKVQRTTPVCCIVLSLPFMAFAGRSTFVDRVSSAQFTSGVEVCEYVDSTKGGGPHSVVGIVRESDPTPRKLTTSDLPEKCPVMSPNGEEIAFFRAGRIGMRSTGGSVPRDWDLYVITRHGEGERRITNMQFRDCGGASFAPDGSNIIFSVMRNEYPKDSFFELRIITATGISPEDRRFVGGRVLLHDGKQNMFPLFSDDGEHVVYVAKSLRKRTIIEVLDLTMGTVLYKWELCLLNIGTGETRILDVSQVPIEGHRFLSGTDRVSYRKGKQTMQLQLRDEANRSR